MKLSYGDTGSGSASSCPSKCDLIQEIQDLRHTFVQETSVLRQLVNQESILRMGLDAQVQDLCKNGHCGPDGITTERATV